MIGVGWQSLQSLQQQSLLHQTDKFKKYELSLGIIHDYLKYRVPKGFISFLGQRGCFFSLLGITNISTKFSFRNTVQKAFQK